MQQSVVDLSAEYKAALNRYNYVTPTSYLSLLKTFSNIFESKRRLEIYIVMSAVPLIVRLSVKLVVLETVMLMACRNWLIRKFKSRECRNNWNF